MPQPPRNPSLADVNETRKRSVELRDMDMRCPWPIQNRMLKIATAYDRQIWFSIKQQGILAILAVLVLDMGQTVRGLVAVMIGYWIGTLVIVMRRPISPSKGDLLFVRWGSSLLAAMGVFAYLVWAAFHN